MSRSSRDPRSPRLARWAVSRVLRIKNQEAFVPELDELYQVKLERLGEWKADLWYWRQLFGFVIRCRRIQRSVELGAQSGPLDRPSGGRARGLESLRQDVKFGIRTLRRRPLFTTVAIATLGLGIGATTTVYTVVDATLLRELPYPDADRLVSIWTSRLNSRDEWVTESLYPPEHRELQAHASTLEDVALYFYAGGSLQGHGDPMNLTVGEGSASLADVAGIQPQLGRWFRPEEVGPEKTFVAVLGDGLWRDRFGADPGVLGTTILLEHSPYTVIGVMPPEFRFKIGLFAGAQGLLSPTPTGERPVWVPSGHNYGSQWYHATDGWSFEAIARLRPGVSFEAAQAEIETLVRGETPADRIRVHVRRRGRLEMAGLPAQLLLLGIPSALLLLIACGNVATLLLGESEGRRGEMATRTAIGAGTSRIVRQLLTESSILGIAGSLVGFVVALVTTKALVVLAPASSAMETVGVNLSVFGFCSAAGVLAGITFGLAPAFMLSRMRGSGLQSHGARQTNRGGRSVNLVLGFEVALTVVLLIAGGLFTRTLMNLNAVDVGFDPVNLVAFRAAIDDGAEGEERAMVYSDMIRRMEAVPGVEKASGSWSMPLLMSLWTEEVATDLTQLVEGAVLPRVSYDMVMPDYHETMGIPLLFGRRFTFADGKGAPPVVIVSESTAREMWPDQPAVGQRLKLGSEEDWFSVVGVVGDVKYGGLDSELRSPIYRAYLQDPDQNGIRLVLTARTSVDPSEVAKQMASAARSAYPSVLLREGVEMSEVVSTTATDQRYRALLVMIFGLAAVIMAAVGIFGVVARAVARRSRELAIRLALGAEAVGLKALVLKRTLVTGGLGIVAGLVVAGLGSRFLAGVLFGVEPSDPVTFLTVTGAVLVMCFVAGYLPARRLMQLQPARVLKEE